jgi:soluble cytochrome b562
MYDAALQDVASGLEQAPESSTLKKTRRIVLERQRAHEELKRDALKT